ncbi:hypothetical protein FRC12_004148 [Ceratobasidium sp. 428]|nr:hypothetical protein FRC12_004148 [Ceratobasidium sp. 428]
MPPAKKQSGRDTQAKIPQGHRSGGRGRNRQNARGGRAGRSKRDPPVPPEPAHDSVDDWAHPLSHDTWGQVDPSGWGAEQNSGWTSAWHDDWAMEGYTGAKIVAWIQEVEACDTCDIARPPSATSDAGTTSSTQPIISTGDNADTPTHQADPQLYRWALDFLNKTAVSADRKRRALQFLNQPRQQQFETIYVLLRELRNT